MTNNAKEIIKLQKIVFIVSTLLFAIKVFAWWLTGSVAILTDALESIINVVAGGFTLYSLYVSFLPKDQNHPYGHGKIEFIAAGIEGTLIALAGIYIFYEAIMQLIENKHTVQQLGSGIFLVGLAGLINYILGFITIKKGKEQKSLPLIAGGKHLMSDSYSSIALILGLGLVMLTDWLWLDSVIAICFSLFISYTGFHIIREAVAGIMDEADEELLKEYLDVLNKHRTENWIDIHNIRFIKYGSNLHLDCHLTVPWFFNTREAHKEYEKLREVTNEYFEHQVELFVHIDDCVPESCEVCERFECPLRQRKFIKRVTWDTENTTQIPRHRIENVHKQQQQNPSI